MVEQVVCSIRDDGGVEGVVSVPVEVELRNQGGHPALRVGRGELLGALSDGRQGGFDVGHEAPHGCLMDSVVGNR